jgi:tRNA (guanine37-N1)-methyltransferase
MPDAGLRIDIVTGFPKLLRSPLNESIIRQAKKKKLIRVRVHDLRKYTHDRHKTIDDTPYGGGAGMVLKPEPIFECVEALQAKRTYDEIIYMSADGERLTQSLANELSMKQNLILLCGHYKGIDERVRRSLVTREISIGDYVLTGGELPALVVVDALIRLLPGVLGDSESMLTDSFQDGLLDGPAYTKPALYRDMNVPDVLLSGDHKAIARWRQEQRMSRTAERRKDLLS